MISKQLLQQFRGIIYMIKRIIFTVIAYISLLILLLNTSHADNKTDPPVNIVVIIDTSDRISNEIHPDQRAKDIFILKEIVDQFYGLVDKNDVMKGDFKLHKLTFVVPEQPNVPAPPNNIMEKLTITAPKNRKEYQPFLNRKEILKRDFEGLYNYVQQHRQTGSDIWNWFRVQANPTFQKDYQNLVICLSDGYLNFDIIRPKGTYMKVRNLRSNPEDAINKIKNGNERLLSVGDFSGFNIKFLMLEIQLHEERGVRYFQDFGIIQAYWETWFNDMGIKHTKFYEGLGTAALRNEIGRFISIPLKRR